MQAKLRNLRISPRKVRLVVDMIRGKSVPKAIGILTFTVKRAKTPVLKLLNSAIANSKDISKTPIDFNNLYISEIRVDNGSILKRHRPRSKGMSNPIHKRTSHVIIRLDKIGNDIKSKTKTIIQNGKQRAKNKTTQKIQNAKIKMENTKQQLKTKSVKRKVPSVAKRETKDVKHKTTTKNSKE